MVGLCFCAVYRSWSSISDMLWCSLVQITYVRYIWTLIDAKTKTAFRAYSFWANGQKLWGDKEIVRTSTCQKGQIQVDNSANFGDTNISPSINWFKIALRIKLQFDFWHEIVFWQTYGSFLVIFWPSVLSIKASTSTKVYVRISETLCIDKIWWTADTWHARYLGES
jgi:hypothetical protein